MRWRLRELPAEAETVGKLARSRTAPVRAVQRSQIPSRARAGQGESAIAVVSKRGTRLRRPLTSPSELTQARRRMHPTGGLSLENWPLSGGEGTLSTASLPPKDPAC